eukprot:2991618-Prymnesium_polylepis.1
MPCGSATSTPLGRQCGFRVCSVYCDRTVIRVVARARDRVFFAVAYGYKDSFMHAALLAASVAWHGITKSKTQPGPAPPGAAWACARAGTGKREAGTRAQCRETPW